jgi:hypothetical protein
LRISRRNTDGSMVAVIQTRPTAAELRFGAPRAHMQALQTLAEFVDTRRYTIWHIAAYKTDNEQQLLERIVFVYLHDLDEYHGPLDAPEDLLRWQRHRG